MNPETDNDSHEVRDMPPLEEPQPQPRPSWLTPQVIWAIVAFLAGTLFSAGMGWGRNSSLLDSLTQSSARTESEVTALRADMEHIIQDYNGTTLNISVKLAQMEQHIEADDKRLDRVESGQH